MHKIRREKSIFRDFGRIFGGCGKLLMGREGLSCGKLLGLILIIFATAIVIAPSVFAAECGGVETSIIECENGSNGIWTILLLILNILTAGVGILGTLGVIISGLQYMSSAGNPEMMTKAKKRLTEVAIGLITYGVMYAVLVFLIPGGISIPDVAVESVTASIGNSTITEGGSTKVTALVQPYNANDTSVTWSSSNESVATVNKYGVVEGEERGHSDDYSDCEERDDFKYDGHG